VLLIWFGFNNITTAIMKKDILCRLPHVHVLKGEVSIHNNTSAIKPSAQIVTY
jgi:hypothetical protein